MIRKFSEFINESAGKSKFINSNIIKFIKATNAKPLKTIFKTGKQIDKSYFKSLDKLNTPVQLAYYAEADRSNMELAKKYKIKISRARGPEGPGIIIFAALEQ